MVGGRAPEGVVVALDHRFGLDRPLPNQYVTFVGHAIKGDLGESIILRRPVAGVVRERIGPSLFLWATQRYLRSCSRYPSGSFQHAARNRAPDHIIRLFTLVAFAMPAFWLGLILVRAFSLGLGWFPVSGYGRGSWGMSRA